MQDVLNHSIFGNTILGYLSLSGFVIGGLLVVYFFKRYVLGKLKGWAGATETSIDDALIKAIEKFLVPIFYFGVFYIALHTLALSADFQHGLKLAAIVLTTVLVVRFAISAINFGLQAYLNKSADFCKDCLDNLFKHIKKIREYVGYLSKKYSE